MTKKLLIAGIFADLLTITALLYEASKRNNDDNTELYFYRLPEDMYEELI